MTRKLKTVKQSRRRHSAEFKHEAARALAEKVGVAEAGAQLELQTSQLYSWRARVQSTARQGQAYQGLAAENTRLKRLLAEKEQEVAILQKASTYVAKSLT